MCKLYVLSLKFKQSMLYHIAATCYAISKSHRQNFIKSFCKDFGFSVPNNRSKTPRVLSILPVGQNFLDKLLILHIVNVITKLCRSAELSGSFPCCLSGYHTTMSELCANYQKPVNNLQRSVRAGSVNDKFTIPLCYYRRGWFIMDFTELYAQK